MFVVSAYSFSFCNAVSISDNVRSIGWLVNNKLERMCEETALAQCEILCQKNHEIYLSSWQIFGARFNSGTVRERNKIATYSTVMFG
jgi:hypothetical protein